MSITKHLLWLVILVALLLLVGALSVFMSTRPVPVVQLVQGQEEPLNSNAPIPQPPYTPAVQAQLAASHGFQYLVSYTDTGFEPATLLISAGQTVRFTNDSHSDLWVAATGTKLYPAITNGCGSSALDSCGSLAPGDFWEFTFTAPGTWTYTDNVHTDNTGTIIVTAQK